MTEIFFREDMEDYDNDVYYLGILMTLWKASTGDGDFNIESRI